jgi:hypothetical protein
MEKLEEAARSRSEADWIVGMNATRAATIRLRSSFDGAVSLGRVQTPTLAIVARREEEIRAFKPEPYWLVDAVFAADGERVYEGRYHQGAQPRLKAAAEADAIVQAVRGQVGEITKLEKTRRKERVPLLYGPDDSPARGEQPLRLLGPAHPRGRPAPLRGAHRAHVSAHELALHAVGHARRHQADRGAPGAQPELRRGGQVRDGPRCLPLGRRGQRREGHRPPRDHPDALRATASRR